MLENLRHAFLGAVAFVLLGWVTTQPAQLKWMTHHKDVRYALAGALVILALFVVVCLVKAVRPAREKTPARPAYSLAGSGRGRRR